MNLIFIGMGLCWLVIGLEGWFLTQLLRQNGRILLRLEVLEELREHGADAQAERPVSGNGKRALSESKIPRDGLPAGTPAPDFRLPRLDGGELSLSDYLGGKVLLVFSDPHCGPCDSLAPALEKAYRQRPDVPVLMVSRGEPGENRKKVKQYHLTFPIALQRKWEISKQYAIFATPVGYLIDEEGTIVADVAVGGEAILALVSDALPQEVAPVT